jgi:hypothetical protein
MNGSSLSIFALRINCFLSPQREQQPTRAVPFRVAMTLSAPEGFLRNICSTEKVGNFTKRGLILGSTGFWF